MFLAEVIIFIIVALFWWHQYDRKRFRNYPPGPYRFPIIDSILQVVTKSHLPAVAFMKLAEKYGDVMFVKMGATEAVVFSSRDAVREILAHDKGLGRVQFECISERNFHKNLGIIWGYGQPWHELRRFSIRNLRDFGFGRSQVVDIVVNEECTKFLNHVKTEARGNPGNTIHVESDLFGMTFVLVLWRLVSGKDYPLDDPRLKRFIDLNNEFFRSTNFGFDISDSFPFLRDWFPTWAQRTLQHKNSKILFDYGKELLEEHRPKGQKSEPESFIDVFAAKLELEKDNVDTNFTEDQFILTVLDLMVAGAETSSKTMTFGILYMLMYPEIQEKVQKEIDRVVPKESVIDSSFKPQLPYTVATLLEIFRYSTILPTPAPRQATEDFTFRGYTIKKGIALITNVEAVHFSKSMWGDPENFRPERFLNAEGTDLEQKTVDLLETFGNGKRFCLGQSLAETSTFLYFARVMRHFKLSKAPGATLTAEKILGITYTPHPFDIHVTERKF